MEKKNNEPLIKPPETLPKQVYVEGDKDNQVYRPVGNEDAVFLHPDLRVASPKFGSARPMGCRTSAVKDPGRR